MYVLYIYTYYISPSLAPVLLAIQSPIIFMFFTAIVQRHHIDMGPISQLQWDAHPCQTKASLPFFCIKPFQRHIKTPCDAMSM